MRVIYNKSIFFLQKVGGISRYYINLFKNLSNKNCNSKIIAPINKNIFLKNSLDKNIISNYFFKYPNLKILNILNQIIAHYYIKKYKPDIIHDTYYSANLIKFKKIKKVVTIYDLIHEKYQNHYPKIKINEKKNIIKLADHFICISRNTQKDFIKYYNVPKKKTSVVYLGGDHLNVNSNIKKNFFFKDYILYVGSRYKYKNFDILVRALKKININKNLNVVCFGGEEFKKNEFSSFSKKIKFIQVFGTDNLLSHLYKNAICMISTSKNEGFGLPYVEAMHLNCPIISSDIKVAKEICGGAALYFKTNNSDDLLKCIIKVTYNKNIRNKLINIGNIRAKLFTWDKCATNTLKIYNKLLKKNHLKDDR